MFIKKIIFLCLIMRTFTNCSTETVKRFISLNNGKYSVDWEFNLETEIIVFTLDAETIGFVGFGISMNPNMAGADIVIGGVRNGQAYFQDYHATANRAPQIDESQDWDLLSASESNGHTHLKFSRKLNTCDELGDVAITIDTQYMIWAIGDTDDIGYHGRDTERRGPQIVNFLDAPTPAADLSQYEIFPIRRNHELLRQDTSYWCTIHRLPDFNTTKHHVIAFNTSLTNEMAIKHTHHLSLYSCSLPAGQSTEFFEEYVDHPGAECSVIQSFAPGPYCQAAYYVWAVGGEMMVLPEMAGCPVGNTGRQEYFMLEVHIDNPGLETGIFELGVDLFYTDKLREFDAAVFGTAHMVNHLQIIPPRSDNFMNVAHCSAECTSRLVPEEGMTLISFLFHAHKAAKKMRTRIIRDGIELPWLAVDDHYNYDYQTVRPFKDFRKVLPGDHIITECTYDTSMRSNVTIGGRPSTYEMCVAWFWHYPKGPLWCDSTPLPDLNDFFGIESYNASNLSDERIMIKPDRIAGMRFSDYLNTQNWTDDLKSRLENALVYGPHQTRCYGGGVNIPVLYPEIRQVYVEQNVCADDIGGGGDRNSAKIVQLCLVSTLIMICMKFLNGF